MDNHTVAFELDQLVYNKPANYKAFEISVLVSSLN